MSEPTKTTIELRDGYVVIKRPGSKETRRMSIEGILRATGVLEKGEAVEWKPSDGGKARP